MRQFAYLSAVTLLALAGCASVAPVSGPAVSVINSITYDNAITGKRDGQRSAWPAAALAHSTEPFPMAQVKQCDKDGTHCSWGVIKAQRSFGKVKVEPAGVMVELDVALEVDRSLRNRNSEQDTTLTIPADVGALQAKQVQKHSMMLEWGKVTRIDFKYGINYEVCAQRLDAAGKALDECALTVF
jgi:hypothetical protein